MHPVWKTSIICAIFLNYQTCCLSARNNEIVNASSSGSTAPTANRKFVVVFDIDDTLCAKADSQEQLTYARQNQPESSFIFGVPNSVCYVCVPYLQVLFEYLLEKNVRLVFFSAGSMERNVLLITRLLLSFWDRETFIALRLDGQFDILSREDTHYDGPVGEDAQRKKDLQKVIKEGETLWDAILVDDNPKNTVSGQGPCLNILKLRSWLVKRKEDSECPIYNIYYMVGVFKTYFEDDRYSKMPLREGIKEMNLPERLKINKGLVRKIVDLGYSEVLSRRGNAKSISKASTLSTIFGFCIFSNYC